LMDASVEFQSQIFDRRSRHPLIFNWINRLVRDKQQVSMNDKAKELVAEAKARLPARGSAIGHKGADRQSTR